MAVHFSIFHVFQKWATNDTLAPSVLVYATKERLAGRYGNALKAINKYLSDAPLEGGEKAQDAKKVWSMRTLLLTDLEWKIWADYDGTVS